MTEPRSEHHSVLSDEQLAPPLPGEGLLTLTRWLMLLETNLRMCWIAYCVIGLFAAMAWFDLFRYLPPFLHFVVLAGFTAALMHFLWGTTAGWQLPSVTVAARRLETANALRHRPYEALQATPLLAPRDSAGKTLWQQHQERARKKLQGLHLPLPRLGATADPYHLRALVAVLLVGSLFAGQGELSARLQRALQPNTSAPQFGPVAKITAWATPPTYTGLPPIMLAEGGKVSAKNDSIRLPVGSTLALRVAALSAAPDLVTDTTTTPFTVSGTESYALDMAVAETKQIKITAGWFTLARWPVTIVPDAPPQIAWKDQPKLDAQQNVKFTYHASDDYGISKTQLVMNLAVSARGLPTAPQIFPLTGAGQKQYEGKSSLPLAASLWSGMPVTLVAEVTDQAGQSGHTPSFTLTLPEHVFTDPLAKELAALRQGLLLDPEGNWKRTLNTLVAITRDVPRYRGDARILLGLRSTAVRMYLDKAQKDLTAVTTTLWEMALALDGGGLAAASEKLRTAQQQLEQALASHADSATVEQKMQELQQALQEYAQNLARSAPQEDGQEIPQDLLEEAGKNLAQELQQKLKEIQDLNATGAHEAAAQKMRELEKMLEELQQAKPMTEEQKQQVQNLKEMRNLIEQQEKLQEQTGKAEQQKPQGTPQSQSTPQSPEPKPTYASPRPPEEYPEEKPGQEQKQQAQERPQPGQGGDQQPGQPGGEQGGKNAGKSQNSGQQSGQASAGENGAGEKGKEGAEAGKTEQQPNGQGLAQQQGELRKKLGKMVEDMTAHEPQPPEQLGTADQGMKSAGEKLGQEQYRGAQQEQGKTLQALKELAGKMKQELQQQIMALPMGGGTGETGKNRSPFSRSDKEGGRGSVDQDVKVPDQQEVQRARKILDELRRRSGEYERPKDERSYIERLLNRF